MSISDKERKAARAKYGWDSVEKDLALTTKLTVVEASTFGRPFMEHIGIQPYDLVEWVHRYYRSDGSPDALRRLIQSAYEAGKADQ